MEPVNLLTARPLLDLMLARRGMEPPILDPLAAWQVFREYLAVPAASGPTVAGFSCSVVNDEALGAGILVRLIREVTAEMDQGTWTRNVFLQLVYNESQEGLEDRDLWLEPGGSLAEWFAEVEALPEFRFAMEATPAGGEVFVEDVAPA
jgi:hypothetical protein